VQCTAVARSPSRAEAGLREEPVRDRTRKIWIKSWLWLAVGPLIGRNKIDLVDGLRGVDFSPADKILMRNNPSSDTTRSSREIARCAFGQRDHLHEQREDQGGHEEHQHQPRLDESEHHTNSASRKRNHDKLCQQTFTCGWTDNSFIHPRSV